MNEPHIVVCPKIENLIELIKELINRTPAGKTLVIFYNGDSEITCSISEKKILRVRDINYDYASDLQLFLYSKDFEFKFFRVSKTAFEATFKKKRVH